LTVPLIEWVFLGASGSGSVTRTSILLALVSYGAVVLATIALSCAVPMAISLTARTTVEALLKSYVFLVALFGGTYLVHAVLQRYQGSGLAGVPVRPELIPLLFGGLMIVAVLIVIVRSLRLGRPGGIPRNLLALLPLVLAGAGVAVLVQRLALDPQLGKAWESLLGVFSPFLAVTQIASHLQGGRQAGSALPPATCYVLFASTFAIAVLVSTGLRWRQVAFEEGD
jgi:hypothetical protein